MLTHTVHRPRLKLGALPLPYLPLPFPRNKRYRRSVVRAVCGPLPYVLRSAVDVTPRRFANGGRAASCQRIKSFEDDQLFAQISRGSSKSVRELFQEQLSDLPWLLGQGSLDEFEDEEDSEEQAVRERLLARLQAQQEQIDEEEFLKYTEQELGIQEMSLDEVSKRVGAKQLAKDWEIAQKSLTTTGLFKYRPPGTAIAPKPVRGTDSRSTGPPTPGASLFSKPSRFGRGVVTKQLPLDPTPYFFPGENPQQYGQQLEGKPSLAQKPSRPQSAPAHLAPGPRVLRPKREVIADALQRDLELFGPLTPPPPPPKAPPAPAPDLLQKPNFVPAHMTALRQQLGRMRGPAGPGMSRPGSPNTGAAAANPMTMPGYSPWGVPAAGTLTQTQAPSAPVPQLLGRPSLKGSSAVASSSSAAAAATWQPPPVSDEAMLDVVDLVTSVSINSSVPLSGVTVNTAYFDQLGLSDDDDLEDWETLVLRRFQDDINQTQAATAQDNTSTLSPSNGIDLVVPAGTMPPPTLDNPFLGTTPHTVSTDPAEVSSLQPPPSLQAKPRLAPPSRPAKQTPAKQMQKKTGKPTPPPARATPPSVASVAAPAAPETVVPPPALSLKARPARAPGKPTAQAPPVAQVASPPKPTAPALPIPQVAAPPKLTAPLKPTETVKPQKPQSSKPAVEQKPSAPTAVKPATIDPPPDRMQKAAATATQKPQLIPPTQKPQSIPSTQKPQSIAETTVPVAPTEKPQLKKPPQTPAATPAAAVAAAAAAAAGVQPTMPKASKPAQPPAIKSVKSPVLESPTSPVQESPVIRTVPKAPLPPTPAPAPPPQRPLAKPQAKQPPAKPDTQPTLPSSPPPPPTAAVPAALPPVAPPQPTTPKMQPSPATKDKPAAPPVVKKLVQPAVVATPTNTELTPRPATPPKPSAATSQTTTQPLPTASQTPTQAPTVTPADKPVARPPVQQPRKPTPNVKQEEVQGSTLPKPASVPSARTQRTGSVEAPVPAPAKPDTKQVPTAVPKQALTPSLVATPVVDVPREPSSGPVTVTDASSSIMPTDEPTASTSTEPVTERAPEPGVSNPESTSALQPRPPLSPPPRAPVAKPKLPTTSSLPPPTSQATPVTSSSSSTAVVGTEGSSAEGRSVPPQQQSAPVQMPSRPKTKPPRLGVESRPKRMRSMNGRQIGVSGNGAGSANGGAGEASGREEAAVVESRKREEMVERAEQHRLNRQVLGALVVRHNSGGVLLQTTTGVLGFLVVSRMQSSTLQLLAELEKRLQASVAAERQGAPLSPADMKGCRKKALATLQGTFFQVSIVAVNKETGRVFFEEARLASSEESEEGATVADEAAERVAAATLDVLEENIGNTVVGTVVDVNGTFCTLKFEVMLESGSQVPVTGTIHKSQISWEGVVDPTTVYSLGEEVSAVVMVVDRVRQWVQLSARHTQAVSSYAVPQTGAHTQQQEATSLPEIDPSVPLEAALQLSGLLDAHRGILSTELGPKSLARATALELRVMLKKAEVQTDQDAVGMYEVLVHCGLERQSVRVTTSLGRDEFRGVLADVLSSME